MTDTRRGFELRAGYEDFSGGSFAFGEGETFDIKKHLDEGNGIVISDDPVAIETLSNLEYLKPVGRDRLPALPEPTPDPEPETPEPNNQGDSSSDDPGENPPEPPVDPPSEVIPPPPTGRSILKKGG